LSESPITARFIESSSRRVLVVARRPAASTGRAVLIAPPFAEEMNKSRRMLSEAARALAARGVATVLPDLGGTGDSSGEFGDADWESWRADLVATAHWSAAEGWPIAALLGVRTGCILGAQAARGLPGGVTRSAFWQPVTDGGRFLTQFLRLRVAASMMEGASETSGGLRERLAREERLEVSGYQLSKRLAAQVEELQLAEAVSAEVGQLHWMEVTRTAADSLAPSSQRTVESMRQAGVAVTTHTIPGEPFWTSTEVVTVPGLIARTVDVLAGAL
jgi:exosortase A-associated hydrolase 2